MLSVMLQCNHARAANEGDSFRGGNNNQPTDSDGISPALKRFKLLSARVSTEIITSVAGSKTPLTDKIHLSTGGRLVALVCGAE